MSKNKVYTLEEMLYWLVKHFEDKKYEVKQYSPDFSPVRVPLYCIKEGKFNWDKVPGDDSKVFQEFLMKYVDFNLVPDTSINKSEDGKKITISYDAKSIIVTVQEGRLCLQTDDGRTHKLISEKKKDDLYIFDEAVIEITTARNISKSEFFPELPMGEGARKVTILEASPAKFYQYYFPKAKIFYAVPAYVNNNEEFQGFKNVCVKRGIGLLNTSKKGIEEDIESRPLFDGICDQLNNDFKKHEDIPTIVGEDIPTTVGEDIQTTVGGYLEDYLHYLVYYPVPQYKRSSIIEKKPGQISRILIDKLQDLKNIQYADKLKELASKYRNKIGDDADIALDYTSELWIDNLNMEYPDIHRNLEEILLRDKLYRDHYVHQFQVFLIGAYILDKMYVTRGFSRIINSFEENYKCKIENAWLAASTYHDFNYGLQKFDDWLLQYFSDTLGIKNQEAKDHLNLLNLDAAMVRESLTEKIKNIVRCLNLDEDTENKTLKFFYEKTSRDRNHGVLSALSILKLYENKNTNLKLGREVMNQVGLAIACHDEDIWEALCGCKGYLRSNDKCENPCERKLYDNKDIAVHKVNLSNKRDNGRCEIWEQELMEKSIFKKISFNKHPLIFLLILCDTIQEEGRITSSSISNHPPLSEEEFVIKIGESNFDHWINTDKKFQEFMKREKKQAGKIQITFLTNGHQISDEAKIYKIEDKKWKILDEKLVYEIERKKRATTPLLVKVRKKACSLTNLDVVVGKVKIDLSIDGLYEKSKELQRVSWALDDKRFRVQLNEKNTTINKSIQINGSGG